MSERTFELSGPPEHAAAQLWAHLPEKTMLNGEKLPKFDSPEKAADVYLEHLTLEEVKKVVKALIATLQKMRTEREDIFEKNPRWKMQLASCARKKYTCSASLPQPLTP